MLSLLLTLGAGLQAPPVPELPERLAGAEVAAILVSSTTHFVAENPSQEPALLLFGLEGIGPVGHAVLPAGGHLAFPVPRDLSGDHWIQLVRWTGPDRARTPRLSVPHGAGVSGEPLFVAMEAGRLQVWRGNRPTVRIAALHVPDAPPADVPIDLPPNLPDKTLPPA